MQWKQVEENWVLTPAKPKGVIHFLGGAFFAAAPQVAYSRVLEQLAQNNYAIVATPFLNNTFDHRQIARDVHTSFRKARSKLFLDYFPVFGMGHSMGCKIHLLINSLYKPTRAGNIYIAYNNYSADRSIPFFKELSNTIPEMSSMEFTPTPKETEQLVSANYQTTHNLLIKFIDDDIDEIFSLADLLKQKFPKTVSLQTLEGTHLTSMGIDVKWKAGESFSAIDAIAQWVKQEMHKNNHTLEQVLLSWLNQQIR
ncbi:DUF1350 family protein [Pseudanabaena yagii]|uniref:DUF1350 family protein n=1 Tax=Pseudanabaena yagii GIHE-NHR1 TaxID=2722753 RepID=A0ABX1LQW8_9CYAN|nr:DUF1350 family protein [Pseudanabaena yagii]NMF58523.1 DUF1350 family protein [Pseudanabaena yagii GIHE-NHR1]